MPSDFFGINLANVKELIAAIVAIFTFAFTFFRFGRLVGNRADKRKIAELEATVVASRGEIAIFQQRLEDIDKLSGKPQEYWTRTPKFPFNVTLHCGQISSSAPIISVVNFKGGVGKTTICANLAAYFAQAGKRVLLIDFDYQGSLSDTMLAHARVEAFNPTSQRLIEAQDEPDQLRNMAERLTSLSSNLWIYPAFYGFNRSEVYMLFRWLVSKDSEVRYNLHHYLQSTAFQPDSGGGFDIVFIDCPPRLLTGSVNALGASTHVLVPTILDGQSHLATLNTLAAIQQFRQTLNKNLKTLGVVPSLINASSYSRTELHFIEELEREIAKFHDVIPVLKERPIRRKARLARAGGSEVVYFSEANNLETQNVRLMFDQLANYIDQHVQWKPSEPAHRRDSADAYDDRRRFASGS